MTKSTVKLHISLRFVKRCIEQSIFLSTAHLSLNRGSQFFYRVQCVRCQPLTARCGRRSSTFISTHIGEEFEVASMGREPPRDSARRLERLLSFRLERVGNRFVGDCFGVSEDARARGANSIFASGVGVYRTK